MNKYFIIGETIEGALKKYSYADNGNVILLENPLEIETKKLELKIIKGYLSAKKINEDKDFKLDNLTTDNLTTTEMKNLLWLKRMYPELLKYRNFSIAIKFTKKENEKFREYVKERKKKKLNISNIYRIYNFNM